MARKIRLPASAGNRAEARQVLKNFDTPLAGVSVVLNCRDLTSGSASFADEMVLAVLIEGRAARLVVHGAGEEFADQMRAAAEQHSVSERVLVRTAGWAPARLAAALRNRFRVATPSG